MRDGRRSLGQEQALFGTHWEEPPPPPFLDECLVVEGRLKSEQAEPEPILTTGLAVAPPELHPSLVKIGTTWLAKLTGRPRRTR